MNTDNNISDNLHRDDPMQRLRDHWRDVTVDTRGLDDANRSLSRELSAGNAASLQDKLACRLRRVAWIGLAFPVIAIMMFYELEMPLWLCMVYVVFGVAMAVCNRLLGDYVADERLVELPVADALRRAIYIKVCQQRLRITGMIGAVVLIGFLMAEIIDMDSRAALFGALVGLVVGLAIGIPRCVRNARLARKLVESLK